MSTQEYQKFTCRVEEVISGDDLIIFIDLGVEDLWRKTRLRLAGVDTPSAVGQSDATEAGSIRAMVRDIARNRRGVVVVKSRNANSIVGVLTVEARAPQGYVCLNDMLIEKGYKFQREGDAK